MPDGLQLLYPLSEFYRRGEVPLPQVTEINGVHMPEPYRTLLVHEADMTPTLQKFHEQTIGLQILKYHLQRDEYSRQVLLISEKDRKPVEFGAIKIFLQHFPEGARQQIVAGERPLGAILSDERIYHTSRPIAFVRVTPDASIRGTLGLNGANLLFGRRNILLGPSQQILADILELLPPN
jgi:chorismate-pyruvate lyase